MRDVFLYRRRAQALLALILFLTVLCSSGCNIQRAAPPAQTPQVRVTAAVAQDVPVMKEWIGTLDGRVNADIRAEVSGYILKQNYVEGSAVRKGQLLFELDPRPFEAALHQAQGNLAQAQGALQQAYGNLAQAKAALGKADLDVKRYTPLAKTHALSQEEMDNAIQSQLGAQAMVESANAGVAAAKAGIVAAKAQVNAAEVNLGFTRITSPLDGVAGIAKIQVGNLVSPAAGDLTTVSAIDPIRAWFTVSEQEYLASAHQFQTRGPGQVAGGLELVLTDGTVYAHKGTFQTADRQVDVGTGSMRVAALFPNPGNVLRPGQYARVRAVVELRKNATLVPQRAVSELQGSYQIAVVDSANKVTLRNVRLGARVGEMWIVEEGVRTGETVVVEGLQRIRSGMTVDARPDAGAAGTR
jgi:membrane fusion protein (multidrug efflux system)